MLYDGSGGCAAVVGWSPNSFRVVQGCSAKSCRWHLLKNDTNSGWRRKSAENFDLLRAPQQCSTDTAELPAAGAGVSPDIPGLVVGKQAGP